ncbi:hypothetical protein JCM10450v2_003418 [Rhodotorula kratochvilovae]
MDQLDSLLHLEHTFYDQGFQGGLPHGHLHGLIEGRELGRDNAWTLWEEIGYYQGVAALWKGILAAQGTTSGRAVQNLDAILTLSTTFPTSNDSSSLAPSTADDPAASDGIDIAAQLSALRTKYRTACAALGVRPRMAVSAGGAGEGDEGASLKSMGMSV